MRRILQNKVRENETRKEGGLTEQKTIDVDFTPQDLKRLIVPLIIEQLLAITVGLADSIMVAQVGEAAVSAVSLVDSVMILLINIFNALATGGAVVAGQYSLCRYEMHVLPSPGFSSL